MQCTKVNQCDLVKIEQYYFNFLWDTKDFDNPRARDRIKRRIMKNDYNEGGLKITDIECMDKSLKLRQYIRADNSKHNIRAIQNFCAKEVGNNYSMSQDFDKITKLEEVCEIAQETLNVIVDKTRQENYGEKSDVIESTIAINQIAQTNVNIYLKRKSRVFLSCIWRPFKKEGLETFLDLVTANETVMNENRSKRMEPLINAFPANFRDAAGSFNENINRMTNGITHILKADLSWSPIEIVTTRELQWILKSALNRIEKIKWPENCEPINIIMFRNNCKNPKLRNIHFRMIHNDFYTQQRMHKYKMTNNPNCTRCGLVETTKHLM